MKVEKFALELKKTEASRPARISSLHFQSNGTLLCGVAFAEPYLMRLKRSGEGQLETTDLELDLGGDNLGVWSGLRSATTGDTALCVLNRGMLPSFVSKLLSQSSDGKADGELDRWLLTQDGGMGLHARHSVVMLSKDNLTLRHDKMPGALIDIALIGDYLFGLSGSEIWREHYLKPDKRETLRSDLKGNGALHRSSDGTFWLLGKNDRLLRMSLTDIRAKPTPLRLPGGGAFSLSEASAVDGWLYGTCRDSKTLFRVRLNSVSAEEEIQKVADFDAPITALLAVEDDEKGRLVFVLQEARGPALYALDLLRPEDPEILPPAPAVKKLFELRDLGSVRALTLESGEKAILWAAEGTHSKDAVPKLLRISDF